MFISGSKGWATADVLQAESGSRDLGRSQGREIMTESEKRNTEQSEGAEIQGGVRIGR